MFLSKVELAQNVKKAVRNERGGVYCHRPSPSAQQTKARKTAIPFLVRFFLEKTKLSDCSWRMTPPSVWVGMLSKFHGSGRVESDYKEKSLPDRVGSGSV